jgi:hypothetical protein
MTTCQVVTRIMTIDAKTKIVLCIPNFTLFVTCDLSFYADSFGKHKSCSYWCIYFTLCRLQWKEEGHAKGDIWTNELAEEIRLKVLNNPNLDPSIQKGITSLPRYLSLTKDMFAPPQFRFEMGLGNPALDEFAEFVDEEREPLTLREENTRTRMKTTIASIESIRKTRDIDEVGIKASLKEKRIFIRNLKNQHKKEKDPATNHQLKNKVAFAETEKKALDKEMKSHVQFVSDAVEEVAQIKKELADMAKARGITKESIANGIEAILNICGVSKESYHGGD